MAVGLLPQCQRCKHYRGLVARVGLTCAAFGDDKPIPVDIISNAFDHRKPYVGDHDILFQPRLRVSAGVLFLAEENEPKVLLLQRAPGETNEGVWALPGGGLEGGESAEEAARREVREETGLDYDGSLTQWTRVVRDGVDYTTFIGRVPESFVPTLNAEHSAFAWVSPSEIDTLTPAPA